MTGGPKGVSPPHARIEVDMACIYLAVNSTIGLTTLARFKTLLAIQGGK